MEALGKDILSQSEIDSLINALSSGKIEEEEKKKSCQNIVIMIFVVPANFPKSRSAPCSSFMKIMRSLANFLAAYLRVPVQVQLASVSQVTYEEFVFSLPVPTLVTVLR